jgi:hypothetical protein
VKQFLAGYRSNRLVMKSRFEQGKAFLERYGGGLSEEQRQTLENFLKIPDGVLLQRLIRISRLRMSPTGLWRLCLYVLFSGADRRGAVK